MQFAHFRGFFHEIFSPKLLDLQAMSHTTTTEIGLMFTSMTLGALCGTIIGDQVLHRINCRIYLAAVLFFFGTFIIILLWANNFVTLMCIAAILGLFEGALRLMVSLIHKRLQDHQEAFSRVILVNLKWRDACCTCDIRLLFINGLPC